MQAPSCKKFGDIAVGLLLLLMPTLHLAQAEQAKAAPPSIEQELVSEGTFAVKLVSALALGTTDDEVEAESLLGNLGIAPRNGWIADYPVTPDIVGELQDAVRAAADANMLSMGKDEALKRFHDAVAGLDLAVKPYAAGKSRAAESAGAENYPNPTVINNYYYEEGPPVVTYYAPPPDYYYLYDWVPYPFWWFDFWFPGYFILRDFHRVVVVNDRVVVISNHFNDRRSHRVFRIDPVQRFRGRTFSGIGSPRTRESISTGVPRSDRTIFNGPSARRTPRMGVPPAAGGGRMTSPPRGGGRMVSPPAGGSRMTAPPGGGRMTAPPAGGGGGSRERGGRR